LAKNISNDPSAKIKDNFDKTALPHSFKIDDLVWYDDFSPLGKNPKLTPEWQGPAKITEVNDTNARIVLANSKTKILNIMCLKHFFAPEPNKSEIVSNNTNLNFNSEQKLTGPVTCAMKELMDHKNAAQLAINVLCNLTKKHCSMCEWEQSTST
jgi:hypothetical protein